jgi:hypothetical protein
MTDSSIELFEHVLHVDSSNCKAYQNLGNIKNRFTERGFEAKFNVVESNDSDQDPRVIEIYYPYVVNTRGYVQPRVQVEIDCRSLL